MGVVSCSEDGGAKADEGGTLLDGDAVVVAHAHGEFPKGGIVFKDPCLEGVEDALGLAEVGTDAGFVRSVAGHGHEATDSGMLQMLQML